MPKGKLVEESEYRQEEGWYPARLEKVNEREVEFPYKAHHKAVQRGEKNVGDKGSFFNWRWEFTLLNDEYKGDRVSADTDARFSTREDNLPRLAYEALLGRPVEIGEDLDTDVVEGRECKVFLSHAAPYKKPDGTMGYFSNVTAFAPLEASEKPASSFDEKPPF